MLTKLTEQTYQDLSEPGRGSTRYDSDLTLTTGLSRAALSLCARGRCGKRPHKREAGLLFPAEVLITRLPASWATCLIQFTASGCPCPGLSPALGHFTCKYLQQTMLGFTMTSPGHRQRGCMNLRVEEPLSKKVCDVDKPGNPDLGLLSYKIRSNCAQDRPKDTRNDGVMSFPWVFLTRWMRMKNLYGNHVPVNIISPLNMRWWMAEQLKEIAPCVSLLLGFLFPSLPSVLHVCRGWPFVPFPSNSFFDVFPISTAAGAIGVPI